MSKLNNISFSHKTAVITGAGSGLGRALALKFSAEGWKIIVSDRDLASAQETVNMLANPAKATANQTDVRQPEDFIKLKQQAADKFGAVDLLINNAGVSGGGEMATLDRETMDWLLNINFYGVLNGYQAFINDLKNCQRAHVVNIASFAAIANPPASGAYNISKSAVLSMSETIRGELAYSNVGITVVCPSFFRTNLLEGFRSDEDTVKKVAGKLMDKSSLNADEIAGIIYQSVLDNEFMVIPHKESQWHYRIKRWFPEFFFGKIKKMTRYMVADK